MFAQVCSHWGIFKEHQVCPSGSFEVYMFIYTIMGFPMTSLLILLDVFLFLVGIASLRLTWLHSKSKQGIEQSGQIEKNLIV